MLKGPRTVKASAHVFVILLCWMAWMIPGHGETLPEWLAKAGGPQPPESRIRDASGFFSKDSAASKRIAEQVRDLEAENGYKIYLMVEPVLIGTTAPTLASELRQSWLPEGDGLVVVFETDSRSVGIGRNLEAPEDLKGPGPLIPTHETAELITRAMKRIDPKLAPEAFIEALMLKLVEETRGYFKRRDSAPPAGRSLRISLLGIGALTLLALTALGLGWLIRHSTKTQVRSFRFPVVNRPERLGAPCGSSVTSSRFAAPTTRER
jgi:uncharacterized membrane protein YgcG